MKVVGSVDDAMASREIVQTSWKTNEKNNLEHMFILAVSINVTTTAALTVLLMMSSTKRNMQQTHLL